MRQCLLVSWTAPWGASVPFVWGSITAAVPRWVAGQLGCLEWTEEMGAMSKTVSLSVCLASSDSLCLPEYLLPDHSLCYQRSGHGLLRQNPETGSVKAKSQKLKAFCGKQLSITYTCCSERYLSSVVSCFSCGMNSRINYYILRHVYNAVMPATGKNVWRS